MSRRTVFFVSDQTGVTAETLGHSLLTQFGGLEFRPVTLPFVSSVDKAEEAVRKINRAAAEDGLRPIVFSTLVQDELRDVVRIADTDAQTRVLRQASLLGIDLLAGEEASA